VDCFDFNENNVVNEQDLEELVKVIMGGDKERLKGEEDDNDDC
jgi:hypothetical protein